MNNERRWIPAFAGMTTIGAAALKCHPGEGRDPAAFVKHLLTLTMKYTKLLRTYLVRPLAALASLAGRVLAVMPAPFRRRAAYSPNSLLHPCRTGVLSAALPPCHRPNETGS